MNPYAVVSEFENEVAKYAGCKYAVAVDNCTNALFLCCKYLNVREASIPKVTYPSVPCSIINAGGTVKFRDHNWTDHYRLEPYPIYDAARFFERGMYNTVPYTMPEEAYPDAAFLCISFSATKIINIGKGGMILTNDADAVSWFKQARFCGRHEKAVMDDSFDMIGWNMYMTPEQAARGLLLMLNAKDKNYLPPYEYPDLSQFEIYSQRNS
jgi:dTDP-4-amino-4,6-dideoxygalactose transaminase